MAIAAGPKGGFVSQINITPLVDVVLVLLIIFMVVTPMLQRGRDVHLPKAKPAAGEKAASDPLVLSVTPDRKLWVESQESTEADLEGKIAAAVAIEPNKRMLIK